MSLATLRKSVLIKYWGAIELWRSETPHGDAFVILSPGSEDVIYDAGATLNRINELRNEIYDLACKYHLTDIKQRPQRSR